MPMKFKLIFLPEAAKEYQKLDNSVIELVNKCLEELTIRADEVGKPLGNTHYAKLAGCKEIKLRRAGLRIIFRITGEKVEVLTIVLIVAIAGRDGNEVFRLAGKRLEVQVEKVIQVIQDDRRKSP